MNTRDVSAIQAQRHPGRLVSAARRFSQLCVITLWRGWVFMVRCETAECPRQQKLPRLSIRSTAVNRMVATGSGIPAPLSKVGSSAGRVFSFSPDQPASPSDLASRFHSPQALSSGSGRKGAAADQDFRFEHRDRDRDRHRAAGGLPRRVITAGAVVGVGERVGVPRVVHASSVLFVLRVRSLKVIPRNAGDHGTT
jgi:hypothetical protein